MKKIISFLLVMTLVLSVALIALPVAAEDAAEAPVEAENVVIGTIGVAGAFDGIFYNVKPNTTYKLTINKLMFVPTMEDNASWVGDPNKVANLTGIGLACAASNLAPHLAVYKAVDGEIGETPAYGTDLTVDANMQPGESSHVVDKSVAFGWDLAKAGTDSYDSFVYYITTGEDVTELAFVIKASTFPAWAASFTAEAESVSLAECVMDYAPAEITAQNQSTQEDDVLYFDVTPGVEHTLTIEKIMFVPTMQDNASWVSDPNKVANLTGIGLSTEASNTGSNLAIYKAIDGAIVEPREAGTNLVDGGLHYSNAARIADRSLTFSWDYAKASTDTYDSYEFVITPGEGVTQIAIVFSNAAFPAWATSMQMKIAEVSVTVAQHEHEIVDIEEVPATCTATGTTAGKKCSDCNEILEGCTEIPMVDHTKGDLLPEDPATCKKAGVSAGYECTVCKNIIEGREKLNKIDHNYVDGKCTMCNQADPNYVAETEAATNAATNDTTDEKKGCAGVVGSGTVLVALSTLTVLGMGFVSKKKK